MPAYGIYSATTGAVTGANSEQNILTIENPTDSGIVVGISNLSVFGSLRDTSATVFSYRWGRASGLPSGGTVITGQVTGATTTPASVAVVRKLPTATAASGDWWSAPLMSAVLIGVPLTALAIPQVFHDDVLTSRGESEDILLAPGEAAIFRAEANSPGWTHTANIEWRESFV